MNNIKIATKALLACISSAALIAAPVRAESVAGEMENFFNNNGGHVNVTGPTGYQGQSAGYYTGGSIWARTPVKSVNPINIQLPKASGGCGGIDLFAGSFSFINTDQIVSLLKATANNALGFAFQLAIDAISAEIGGVMKDMAAKIQSINEFNMNSCEEAQALVGAVFPAIEGASSTICQTVGVEDGIFSDMARSRHGCSTGGERDSTLAGSADPRTEIVKPRNYTWHALRSRGIDTEYAEFLMSLIGTAIYSRPANAGEDEPGVWRYEHAAEEGVFQELLSGDSAGGIEVLDCDTTAAEGCLDPGYKVLSVTEAQSFYNLTLTEIQNIQANLEAAQPLSTQQIAFINSTTVPIYKILLVNEAAIGGGLNANELRYLSDIIAVDMLVRFIRNAITTVERAQSMAQVPASPQMAEWRDQTKRIRSILRDKEHEVSERLNKMQQIVERTLLLERTLKNKIAPQLAASLNYAQGIGVSR
tara:strand:- start:42208 stop:43635 length:1428 start_codon:yes stop_codon:yes gene_type:complete